MGRIAGGLIACGSILICGLSWAQQEAQPPETTRLIDSIQGPALYAAYCAVCHGKDGKGDGPMAKALKVAPPDLTHLAAHNGGKFPVGRVQKIIGSKEPIPAGHGTREMPVWGPIFSQIAWDQDLGQIRVYNLAQYLEKMQVK
ncbi:MAG TPA: cytochrome c [Bryobacteraceae bacterium]|nr:cytochrome c [Bryobacteraceae bacterium]